MNDVSPMILNPFKSPEEDQVFYRLYYVYFLLFENEVVYVGYTASIEDRIKAHKRDKLFDTYRCFTFRDKTLKEVLAIEEMNIAHYNPIFNNGASILKRPDFCWARIKDRGLRVEKGVIFSREHSLSYWYYNGETLFNYKFNAGYLEYTEDLKRVDGMVKVQFVHFRFDIINDKLVLLPNTEEEKEKIKNQEASGSAKNKNKPNRRSPAGLLEKKVQKPKVKKPVREIVKILHIGSLMPFGRYKSQPVEDVLNFDPNYMIWFAKNAFKGGYTMELSEELKKLGLEFVQE